MVKTAFFAADRDEGAQRGSGRPIPPLVTEIQAATTNTGTKPQGGLTPDFLALSNINQPGPEALYQIISKRGHLPCPDPLDTNSSRAQQHC